MKEETHLKMLEDLGLSMIEAKVYYILLQESPQSAYKIANAIGKSNSNTYLALGNLISKGAVSLLEAKKTKKYSAVSLDDFLEMRVIKAQKQQKSIKEAFKDIDTPSQHDQIFYLNNIDQLYLKAKHMINNAESTILVDGTPEQVEVIRKELARKGKEELIVLVESRLEKPIPNCKNINIELFGEYKKPGFGYLVISVDINLTLVSLFTEDGEIIEALWISNHMLSGWFYNGMFYEIMHRNDLNNLKSKMASEDIIEEMKEFFRKYRTKNPLNINRIVREYGSRSINFYDNEV